MRYRAVFKIVAVIIVVLITWGIANNSFDQLETTRKILSFIDVDQRKPNSRTVAKAPEPKCSLSRVCPPHHFALHITSGAANVVGPKICFDGKIIMSHVFNNVGPGLNVVVVNVKKDILAYLTNIQPGMIVLVASFDDMTTILTNEMREVFVGMGSSLIKSVKHRDNWVFAGIAGTENRSLFEKHAVNDQKTNIYEGWPDVVELSGCFPRTLTDGQTT
ncbi:protein FAM3C isoform X2 [Cottoperca gobio]|uniref:Protein FAM3C isoform X2 n=1 Tax=Cottoperca gobio TaxID=56716 RepID=A0A6J2PRT8_COTGO|nr:protein FAM3C-like isoform X2 [Cottoperca gobio]